eukprot:4243928-Pyramimonas_sp.AAC.1
MRWYPPRGKLTQLIFIDGSGLHPDIDWLTRAGWAAASIRPGTEEVTAAAYGPVPGIEQSSGRAEHYALLQTLHLLNETQGNI